MLFKKEFDIDKEFFMEKPKAASKRKVALRVFIPVLFFTFALLCYSAFTFNFNAKFGEIGGNDSKEGLKEAQEYYFDAIKAYEDGNYTKAIELLNKQISIIEDPDAYNYLAKIYLESGDTALAIENFKKAIEYKSDFFEPNFELGKIYFQLNDYKNASVYLTRASNVQIDNSEVLGLTAEAYKLTGHADEAVVLFEKILSTEPDSAFANAKIGEIYFQRLQYKKAIPYLEDALQITFDTNVAVELAKCYFELGSFESSLSIANEILSEDKDNKQAQSLKRAIEYKTGQLQANKKDKEKETAAKPPIKETKPDPALLNEYIKEIELSIKTNWTPPAGSNLKKASVKFTVDKDGELVSNVIYAGSGLMDFDKSALDAVEMSKPFPPLPDGLMRDSLDIIFTFDFNVKN